MRSKVIFMATLLLLFSRVKVKGSWWNLGATHFQDDDDDDDGDVHGNGLRSEDFDCQNFHGFSSGQKKMCREHSDHMAVVSRGLRMGLDECQWQFRHRRWNCTLGNSTSPFNFPTQAGTPEVGFVYSMMSASVVHSLSRACRNGDLKSCGCSSKKSPPSLPKDWLWQGCGDNSVYGYKFAVAFVDSREREKNYPRRTRELARVLMNIHNNEAGRRAVHAYVRPACKCHGVSGSCNVKTCWNQLPSLRETGNRLKERFNAATEMRFNRHGTNLVQRYRRFNRPTKEDLVYTDPPPDYCLSDHRVGSFGTIGRNCNKTSAGMDGCSLMCCGRGYHSRRMLVREKCHCKFHWCCIVKCKTCEHIVDVQTCK